MDRMNSFESLLSLRIGRGILNDIKEKLGEKEYNKIMSEPIKSCKCGNIKEGDDNICGICEVET